MAVRGERRDYDRRQMRSPVTQERRRSGNGLGRRAGDLAGPGSEVFETRRRRLRIQVIDARRAIEASRDALKKRKG